MPSAENDAALAEQREQIARAIEAERNREWQEHLRLHPFADGTSCPRDYGMHDAYARAARIARETRPIPPGGGDG